jgi:lipopolysaccharide assembly protein A
MIRFISLLVSIPLLIVISTFAYRNAQPVEIDFFTNTIQLPLAAILLIVLLLGGVLGFMLNFYVLMKQKNKIRQMTKQRKEMLGLTDILTKDKK